MKKQYNLIVYLFFLLQSYSVNSQTIWCNDTSIIMDRKGKWTHSTDVIHDREISSAGKKEVFSRIDSVFEFVKEAYLQPIGCEPRWYRTVESKKNKSPFAEGPQPYSFNSLYLKYLCDKRLPELKLETATNSWVWIYVNQLYPLLTKSFLMEINGKKIQTYYLPLKDGEINGLTYYKLSNWSSFSKAILFTRNGETLFTPITRRQYLDWYINDKVTRNKKTEEGIRKTIIRPAAVQEAEKDKNLQKIIDQHAKSTDKRRQGAIDDFLKSYKTDEEKRDENLRRFLDVSEKELKKYYDELNNSDKATLDKPACFGDSKTVFSEKEDGNSHTLVEINESYFKKNLTSYQPQLIIMHWMYDNKHIADRHLNNELVNHFPFHKLQSMIK